MIDREKARERERGREWEKRENAFHKFE